MKKRERNRLAVWALAGMTIWGAAMSTAQAEDLTISSAAEYTEKKAEQESAWFHKVDKPSAPDTGWRLYHSTSASGNTITVSGESSESPITEEYIRIYGGYSAAGAAASNNTISLKNMTLSGAIYGGYSEGDELAQEQAASNNTITLDNVAFSGTIDGGVGLETKNNTINIKNNSDVSNASISGGIATSSDKTNLGNTLNFENWGGKVKGISNIQNLNLTNLQVGNDGGLIAVNGANLQGTTVTIKSVELKDDIDKAEGETLSLISGVSNLDAGKVTTSGVSLSKIAKEITIGTQKAARVMEFGDIEVSNTGVSAAVTQSILAGQYIGSSNDSAGTTTELTVDTSVNATKFAGIYVLSSLANASNGKLTISGVTLGSEESFVELYGGYSGTSLVSGNQVTINSGTVTGEVYGGYAAGDGDYASDNEVTISGGAVTGYMYGGYGEKSDARNNTVNINSGTVTGDVYGGYSEGAVAADNTVTISGGTVSGTVYAGYAERGEASDNTVIISGDADVSQASLWGSNNGSDNILNLADWSGTIKQVNNFDTINLGNITAAGDAHISLTGASNFAGATVTIDSLKVSESLDLAAGTSYTILGGENTTGLDSLANANALQAMKPEDLVKETDNGVRVHQFGGLKLDANAISFSVTDSILAGTYIDSSETSTGTTTELTVDTSVNASKIAGIYSLNGGASKGSLTISGVTLGDEKHAVNLYGGYSETGLVNGNQVTINSSTVSGTVYGGYGGNGADDNTVIISGGAVTGAVYGGYSVISLVNGNQVTINSGTVSGYVYGGGSRLGSVDNNTVTINGGTVSGDVYGGYSGGGSVSNNKVTISGGTVSVGSMEDTPSTMK